MQCAFYPQFTNGVTGSANGETFTLLSTFPWVDKQSAGGVVADCGSPGHPNTQ